MLWQTSHNIKHVHGGAHLKKNAGSIWNRIVFAESIKMRNVSPPSFSSGRLPALFHQRTITMTGFQPASFSTFFFTLWKPFMSKLESNFFYVKVTFSSLPKHFYPTRKSNCCRFMYIIDISSKFYHKCSLEMLLLHLKELQKNVMRGK